MASQVVLPAELLQNCESTETVIKELQRTYGLTTLLHQELATILNHSVHFQVHAMFQELQRALKSSLNFLCNAQVVRNQGIQGGSANRKRKRLDDKRPVPVVNSSSRTVAKDVIRSANPFDDGYLWRKYGRKNILNEMFPRDYYRCIYSNDVDYNCKAKKYVQKYCNGDPPQYKVIYIHGHTCNCNSNSTTTRVASSNLLAISDSAKQLVPQSQPSLSDLSSQHQHGSSIRISSRDEEEQAALLLSCLKDIVIGGTAGTSPQMDHSALQGCHDVVSVPVPVPVSHSQPMEPSHVNLASSCQAWEDVMDDMVMMDLFWQELSQINYS